MKIKNSEIWVSREPLQALVEMKLPAKVSYHLAKLAQKLDSEFQTIEQVRNGLVKKYGKVSEDGRISVTQEMDTFPKFVEEFTEVLDQEVELVFDVVKIPSMVDGKTLEIETKILIPLMKFVEVVEP